MYLSAKSVRMSDGKLRWLAFKFYFPYYWILLPPAIFNANDFVPEVCGRRKHATIKRKTMRKTGSQDVLTSGAARDGVWAFLQDIVQITQRILISCYIGWMAVDEEGHFQKVKIYIKTKCQVSIEFAKWCIGFWNSKLLIDLGTDFKHLHGWKSRTMIFP